MPVLALVLIAGLAGAGWAYATGRLGFGPLSGADKDAAALIADEVEGPEWADDDQRACATDQLLHESRSADLEAAGLIERDDDDWSYTGTWPAGEATAYFDAVLECADDWPDQVGEVWALDDTECLADLDQETVAEFLAAETLTLADPTDAEDATTETVEGLDECYATDPTAPDGKASAAYRSVRFTFTTPEVANAEVTLRVGPKGEEPQRLKRATFTLDTEMGGRQGCVVAETVATYGWGTKRTAEAQLCGKSEPAEIFWKELPSCQGDPPCNSWELRYEGWEGLVSVSAELSENGGSCNSVSGECTFSTITDPSGRGVIVTWSAFPGWSTTFTAKVGSMTATLPN